MHLTEESLGEGSDDILQSGLEILAEGTLLVNGGNEVLLVGAEMGKEVSLPLKDLVDRNGIEVAVDTGVDEGNHLVNGHGGVLLLLEKLGQLQMCLLA
jgi:hypothetical protein